MVLPVAPELPLGEQIDWKGAQAPTRTTLRGAHVLLRPVDPVRDAEPLYAVSHPPDGDETIWTYLPDGPYESPEKLRRMLASVESSEDPLFFTIEPDAGERPLGLCCYMRIKPHWGVIEIGHIWFGAPLKRTTAATEAIYLMARHAFDDLGYRRLEWKCNSLNAASRRAADRLGFSFEGVFHKHQIVKGRNRDTAWYAITDEQWPVIRAGFEAWLSPENIANDGLQRRSLADLRGEALSQGPGSLQ
jgi:RimJ/RimL family protein N-acetyltransferase